MTVDRSSALWGAAFEGFFDSPLQPREHVQDGAFAVAACVGILLPILMRLDRGLQLSTEELHLRELRPPIA